MDWGFTLAVVVTGIVVVFVVLIVLVMLCTSMGAFFSTENQAPTKVELEPKNQVEPQIVEQTTIQPIIEEGISQEVIAAISGSLAVIMGEENQDYRISSVKKSSIQSNVTGKRSSRNVWSSTGFVENTTPF